MVGSPPLPSPGLGALRGFLYLTLPTVLGKGHHCRSHRTEQTEPHRDSPRSSTPLCTVGLHTVWFNGHRRMPGLGMRTTPQSQGQSQRTAPTHPPLQRKNLLCWQALEACRTQRGTTGLCPAAPLFKKLRLGDRIPWEYRAT